ncbi:TolC family protein [Brevundimonas sp.]|uniref:TolC family protein n=1 Tax=Brevundimonas sp. TaxID=1871086 RepID=UPI0025BB03CB|nr:TolC family protein [Brevundimonas sp.]
MSQAEAEYRATEQLVPQLELAVRRQEHGLTLLLGVSPGPVPRGAALAEMRLPALSAGLPADLLRRRPDIAQAEQSLAATDHALQAARAAFMPSVQLNAATGYVGSSLLDDPVSVFSIGASILAPLFDSGRLDAQARGAAARRDQAAFAYRKAVLTAFREVEDGLAAVAWTTRQEAALDAQHDALQRVFDQAARRHAEGYSPYLEQLDAQRTLLQADLALIQIRNDRLLAVVALYQALGGGWSLSEKGG